MKFLVFAILLIWAPAGYLAEGDTCGEDEDALALAGDRVYRTETLAEDLGLETPEDALKKAKRKVQKALEDDPKLAELAEALNSKTDPSMNEVAESADGPAKLDALTSQFYYDLCPQRWSRLKYWEWYFVYSNRKYCWSIYNVWVANCINRYCKFSPVNQYLWYFYYRCVPEYRRVLIPSVCVTIREDGSTVWSSEYLVRSIPRGCNCRRYWRWQVPKATCPVVNDVELTAV